jgi:glycosyltransferase involved in cell wall biosynthesis
MSVRLASVVLPVYNQAGHIGAALQEYVAVLDQLHFDYELLPVINGPRRDNSLEICRELEKTCGRIRTLCIDQSGWGAAVQQGLSQAAGDLLCYANSARTPGKDLALFLVYGSIHRDSVIKANRRIRESLRRRFASLLYNLECRMLFDLPYWDINGTPKVFSRQLVHLRNLKQAGDLIDLEFNAICREHSYNVLEVPILSSSRRTGKSTTNWRSGLRMYWGAYQMWREWTARKSV